MSQQTVNRQPFDQTCLKGIRVIDISSYNSGPIAAQVLGDLGAEVWKIERVSGDPTRTYGPFLNSTSIYFQHLNRNKRSMTLNYAKPEGRALFCEIIKDADIVVENFLPGQLKKMGIDYETLAGINPRLIMVSISGYGQKDSPYVNRPSFDIIMQAFAGIVSVTGRPGEPGVKVGVSIMDEVSGYWGALGALAALFERTISGKGQQIDVAMADVGINLLEHYIPSYGLTGADSQRVGNGHALFAPVGGFDSKEGKDTFFISMANQKQAEIVADLIGHPELKTDPRWATPLSRAENRAWSEGLLNEFTRQHTRDENVEIFNRAGIPCAPVNKISDLYKEPHFRQREEIVELEHPTLGSVPLTVTPIRPSRTPLRVDSAGPLLGADNDFLYGEVLHKTAEEIAQLKADGII